jgi:hypothetical protein
LFDTLSEVTKEYQRETGIVTERDH